MFKVSVGITAGDYVILSSNVTLGTFNYPINPYLRAKDIEQWVTYHIRRSCLHRCKYSHFIWRNFQN